MATWPPATPGTRRAVLATATALLLAIAACTSSRQPGTHTLADTPNTHAPQSARASVAAGSSAPRAQGRRTGKPLAVLNGQHHMQLTLTSARRESTVCTVRGMLKNNGPSLLVIPAELRGNETAVLKNGPSLAGATLTDFHAGKRYYVLRDTDARPLTTTGLAQLNPKESVAVFMQFPAPPATTTNVDFELPLFPAATLPLTK
ncbi:hypothetical protein [Streptomyces sp. NPDC054834]